MHFIHRLVDSRTLSFRLRSSVLIASWNNNFNISLSTNVVDSQDHKTPSVIRKTRRFTKVCATENHVRSIHNLSALTTEIKTKTQSMPKAIAKENVSKGDRDPLIIVEASWSFRWILESFSRVLRSLQSILQEESFQ